jgi:hypothetical protein
LTSVATSLPKVDEFKVATSDGAFMYRRIIEANDSCLFNSLGFALSRSLSLAPQLRKHVAEKVLNDPIFNSAILGKSPQEYAKWVQAPNSWGGGIELLILSEYFKAELVAIDIINIRYDIFGQGKGFTQRVFLIYSGIHYDLLAKNYLENGNEETEVSVFSAD